jgi:hypothetical protein
MKCSYYNKGSIVAGNTNIELLKITNIQWEIYKAFKKVKHANRKKI